MMLYTRRGCRLCEEAEDLLASLGATPGIVDVDADSAAAVAYGLRVPVLVANGHVVAEGRFDARRVAAAIASVTGPG